MESERTDGFSPISTWFRHERLQDHVAFKSLSLQPQRPTQTFKHSNLWIFKYSNLCTFKHSKKKNAKSNAVAVPGPDANSGFSERCEMTTGPYKGLQGEIMGYPSGTESHLQYYLVKMDKHEDFWLGPHKSEMKILEPGGRQTRETKSSEPKSGGSRGRCTRRVPNSRTSRPRTVNNGCCRCAPFSRRISRKGRPSSVQKR